MAFTLIKAFGNSVSTAVKLDAYDVEYTTGKARSLCLKLRCDVRHARLREIHSAFIPATGLKCSHGKIFHSAYRDPGRKNRDLGNRASPPSHMNRSKILQRI